MILPTTEKTKCEVKDCKNIAAFFLPAKGKVGKFFLCKQCFEKICSEALKMRTPKSPKNTIKRIIESKTEGV